MGPNERLRVFDRDDWNRKVRVPEWQRHPESEKRSGPVEDRKTSEKW
jgi:hypothetical protein